MVLGKSGKNKKETPHICYRERFFILYNAILVLLVLLWLLYKLLVYPYKDQ